MGHGEVQALGGAIYEIQILEIEDAADARAKPHLNEIRRLLQKRPFDVLLDETPDMNLADFMARKRGDDMMYSMRVFAALRQISLLKGMQNERIWDPDPAIWPHLYRWAEYMSPVYHNIDIDALSPKVRDEIFGLVPGLVRVLQCVTSLPRSEGIAILSDVGYLPLRIAADLWAGWPRIFGSSPTTARAQESVRSLVTMFPLLCTFLDCETPETQGALRSELERLTNGRAHGFLRTIGRNVEMVIDFDDESGRTVYTQMNFARQLVTLRMSIEHVPRATISSAVSALRRFAKSPTSRAAMSIRYSAAGMLLALCPIDPSSLVPAIRLGLFQAFAQIRANCTKDDSAMYKPVLQLIWFAMVQRKAVKALYKSRMDPELEIPPSDIMNLYEVDQMLLATSAQRYRLLKEADADWEKVNTCCNAKERNCARIPMYSCPCGEALYCSRDCRRTHWIDGGHKQLCAFAQSQRQGKTLRPTPPKDMRYITLIAREYVEDNLTSIYDTSTGTAACNIYLASLAGPTPQHERASIPPDAPPSGGWPTVYVTVTYMLGADSQCKRNIVLHGGPDDPDTSRYCMLTRARFSLPELQIPLLGSLDLD